MTVNDNVTNGAYASSMDPQQQKGWYFGGLTTANRTAIKQSVSDTSPLHAGTPADFFYEVDMSQGTYATFKALQYPTQARAQGGLVWLPFGRAGILVALGGTVIPADAFVRTPSTASTNDYMTNLWIYDINGAQWYNQSTLGSSSPKSLARFCTAVVPSNDTKSYGIVVYGGYDGVYATDTAVSDDIWMLSIPSFQWTQLKTGDAAHARQGHVCISPNPSTLITVGGTTKRGNPLNSDSAVDVFNFNTGIWTGNYVASSTDSFLPSDTVWKSLGWPNAKGPGQLVVPESVATGLSSLLAVPYAPTIKPLYPYANSEKTNSTSTPNPEPTKDGPNIPLIVSLAVVLPVLAIIAIIAFCCIYRRKKAVKTTGNKSSVMSWMHGHGKSETSEFTESTAIESSGDYPSTTENKTAHPNIYEADAAHRQQEPGSPGWGAGAGTVGTFSTLPSLPAHPQQQQETYEIYTPPKEGEREAMSIRNHPQYPRSLSGDHIVSATTNPSGSVSKFSEALQPNSPARHEMHSEDVSTAAGTPGGRSPNMSPPLGSTIARKPIAERPYHERNASDLSDLTSLPSPGLEENRRQSKAIDGLPDAPGHSTRLNDVPASPVHGQT